MDSSAIAVVLGRMRRQAVEVLRGNATLDLAGYELGNVIWKECVLKGSISSEEAARRAEEAARVLGIMRIESVESPEDFTEVMKMSTVLKITFYGASYLHLARKRELTLITQDKALERKAEEMEIKAISLDEFLGKRKSKK